MTFPPTYVLTIARSIDRQRQFDAAWPGLSHAYVYGDDYRDHADASSLADCITTHAVGKVVRIIPQYWLPRIFVTFGHLRLLRTALDTHPDAAGILVFEDDAIPAGPGALESIASAIARHPDRSQKFAGTPDGPDWACFACSYVTLPAIERILAAEELCNIDWMFWRFARPDVCKPYVVTTVGPGTYDLSTVLVPFDDILFADHSPGNNQGDGIGLAELLGWASVKHASVVDVVRELTKRQPSGTVWTKIQEFCELGVDGIYATTEPFRVYRQRDRWYIGAGCKRAIALCWLGESNLDLRRIGVRP
jgi:hypothetical protein